MYVKVLGTPTYLKDAGSEVTWGTHIIHDGRTELGDVAWREELDLHYESLHLLVTSGPDGELDGAPWWSFKYAWWYRDGVGIEGVVANRPIYILGENGKTIDRV